MKKAYYWIVAMVLLTFVVTGIFLTAAPEQIPVHYDIRGNIDRWGSKYEFLVFPVISLVFGCTMAWIARVTGKKGEEFNEKVVTGMAAVVLVFFNAMFAFFMWKALTPDTLSNGSEEIGVKILLVLFGASFIPLGNILPKTTRNGMIGLRTKWSMADDVCWQKSQRLGGMLMVTTGILAVVLVSLLPVSWGVAVLLVLLLADVVASVWGSWRIYQKAYKQ